MTSTNSGVEWAFETGGPNAASSFLAFRDIGNSAERMRLDASGNLGLGTTSPVSYANFIYATINGTNGAGLRLQNTAGTAISEIYENSTGLGIASISNLPILFLTNNTERARITNTGKFNVGTVNGFINLTNIKIDAGGRYNSGIAGVGSYSFGAADSGGAFVINDTSAGTTETERARIDSSGNLLVGQTSWAFANNGTQIAASGRIFNTSNTDYNMELAGSTSARLRFYSNAGGSGTTVGSITVDATNTQYNTSSDYRLKNITGPITTSGAYIDSLNPVEGTWKIDGSTFVGLLAHEAQEVSRTKLATGVKDGPDMQGMAYASAEIIANLIAEIQSLRQRVAQLEGKS
jgi:hypothetical protein